MNSTIQELMASSRDVLKFRPRYTSKDYYCTSCQTRKPHDKFDMLELIQINMGVTGICRRCTIRPYHLNNIPRISDDVSSIERPSLIKEISGYHDIKMYNDDYMVVDGIEMVDEDTNRVNNRDRDMDYSLSVDTPLSQSFEIKKKEEEEEEEEEEKQLCYLCHDEDTNTHVSCLNCKKQYHVQCLRSMWFDECPFCKETWKRSTENARVQDLKLLGRKRVFLSNMLMNVKCEIELYESGIIFDKGIKNIKRLLSKPNKIRSTLQD